ncbi:hypothetical protein B1C78_08370 [Thioalkalivibrio denitrificans]|uniref:Uncharacterized protein n=1 Tax=Thioalkalivibrio denitrificans TaxID=108003 RepID=A0A1V3NIL3_9GAMM|nr:circularly permuted type 2 ATP-grasp protein [Thioalkalivibrio denitrificans]OOG24606.1 hypothetical protein B1C78_08370 [Thioalkalivibrio denitrificans]
MSATPDDSRFLHERYAPPEGVYDELCAAPGAPRPHWTGIMESLEGLGREGLLTRADEARRLLGETGVTYNVYSDPRGAERPWPLDPVPLLMDSGEWARVETGLVQRTELLNLTLRDLYGPRHLIRRGILPPDLVFGQLGFLHACDNLPLPEQALTLYACDLARGPDGQLWVLGDRAQAPSGAGYALENRVVLSRVFPSLYRQAGVHRLTGFFHALRQRLASLSPRQDAEPRVVLLSPGPLNETWFEHVYLAGYLGYTLVQGEDLLFSGGRVWLRSLGGPEPVDVVLRRVDDVYCDSLELHQDSRLGVAGLVEAVRRGQVAVANPLGSAVLESPALSAFLPAIGRYFLGQDPELPSVDTWWCGDPGGLEHVLANLERLVVRRVDGPGRSSRPVFGALLSGQELEALRTRIRAHPGRYVGQEQIALSTAPVLAEDGAFEARHAALRAFLCAREDDYLVMPGGLTRVAGRPGDMVVSNQEGGLSKDTWVLSSEPEPASGPLAAIPEGPAVGMQSSLPSRVAENLFWMGRYAERAEGTLRLIRGVLKRRRQARDLSGPHEQAALDALLRALTHLTTCYPGFVGEGGGERLTAPESEILSLITDGERPGTLRFTLSSLFQAAYALRDRVSGDSWRVLASLREQSRNLVADAATDPEELRDNLDEVVTRLLALSGLAQESTIRQTGWVFLDTGRRLERAQLTVNLLRATLVARQEFMAESLLMEAVLAWGESLTAYRTGHRAPPEMSGVLDLMLQESANPRALLFQLERLDEHVRKLPEPGSGGRVSSLARPVLEALMTLRLADPDALVQADPDSGVRGALDQLLARQSHLLHETAEALVAQYFAFAHSQHALDPESSS